MESGKWDKNNRTMFVGSDLELVFRRSHSMSPKWREETGVRVFLKFVHFYNTRNWDFWPCTHYTRDLSLCYTLGLLFLLRLTLINYLAGPWTHLLPGKTELEVFMLNIQEERFWRRRRRRSRRPIKSWALSCEWAAPQTCGWKKLCKSFSGRMSREAWGGNGRCPPCAIF